MPRRHRCPEPVANESIARNDDAAPLLMQRYEITFHAMGTRCSAQLYAGSEQKAQQVLHQVIREVARLEAKYSRYRADSLLSSINKAALLGGSIEVDAETALLLDYANTCHAESGGLFDISSGILRKAWDFKSGKIPDPPQPVSARSACTWGGSGILPDPPQVQALLALTGWDKVSWQTPRLDFPVAGMELDLGGIVKEYAVDRAASLCLERDIQHGLINLGGDIRIIGPHADGSAWQVGISDPADPSRSIQQLSLRGGALASSGDYERCITLDGVRYGHILNPKTGWPVKNMAAVSVVADLCVVAGSASTIAMLMDARGPKWLETLGLQHLWMDVQGRSGGSLVPASIQ